MPGVTLDIRFGSEMHKRILKGVRDRAKASKDALRRSRFTRWKRAEELSLAYLPERAIDATRRTTEREKGKPTYTTIEIPYSYAVLMASHTYWTTVFMSRTPVMQYTGRHGESQQKVQAIEALVDYQMQVGEMLVPLYIWLHDVGKYGVGIVGVFWDEEVARVSEIVEVQETLFRLINTGKTKKIKRTREVPGYNGNKIFNVRPFDFLPDPRVPLKRFQQGEFCGRYTEISWNTLLERQEQGLYMNLEHIKRGQRSTFNREEGSVALELPEASDFFELRDEKGENPGVVSAIEMPIKIVPEQWQLGRGKLPELWVFTVTADYSVVIGAQPLGANHNRFPFQVIEMEPEGYAVSTRGIHEILESVNNTISWLVNSHFYNVRKTLNNQFLVDPSRVVLKDLLDPLPGGLIRVKPAGYGTDVKQYVHQFETVDITRAHISDIQTMVQMGQRIVGVNDQLLGMLTTKGRQTATEVRTASGFGINRLKTQSEFFSAMGWSPLSQMIVQNSQQYFSLERAFRIVGDLGLDAPSFVGINPEIIQGFYDFVPVDGSLPIDRFAQANLWRNIFTDMQKFPTLLQRFDIGRIFVWVAQLAGLKNISQFRVDLRPDGDLQNEAAKGNIVPIRDVTRIPDARQIPDVGPTS